VRNYSSNAFSSGSLNTVADSDSDNDDDGDDDTDDDSDDDDDDDDSDDDDSDGDYVNYGNKADTNAAEIAEESGPGNGMLLTIIHDITIHYFTSMYHFDFHISYDYHAHLRRELLLNEWMHR
jgi:hypothetical protein